MQYPGSTDNQTDSWATGEVSVGGSSVGGSLLVPEGNEFNTEGDAGFGDLDDGDADDAEDDFDIECLEGLGDKLGAIGREAIGRGRGSHCRERGEGRGRREEEEGGGNSGDCDVNMCGLGGVNRDDRTGKRRNDGMGRAAV